MATHSPGPWTARECRDGDFLIQSDRNIATVDLVNGKANAKLIAAAPELLEFLENLRELSLAGMDAEVLAEARGEFLGKLLAEATG